MLDRASGYQFPFFGPKFQGLRALVSWSEYSPSPFQQTACTWDGYMKKVIRAAYSKE